MTSGPSNTSALLFTLATAGVGIGALWLLSRGERRRAQQGLAADPEDEDDIRTFFREETGEEDPREFQRELARESRFQFTTVKTALKRARPEYVETKEEEDARAALQQQQRRQQERILQRAKLRAELINELLTATDPFVNITPDLVSKVYPPIWSSELEQRYFTPELKAKWLKERQYTSFSTDPAKKAQIEAQREKLLRLRNWDKVENAATIKKLIQEIQGWANEYRRFSESEAAGFLYATNTVVELIEAGHKTRAIELLMKLKERSERLQLLIKSYQEE